MRSKCGKVNLDKNVKSVFLMKNEYHNGPDLLSHVSHKNVSCVNLCGKLVTSFATPHVESQSPNYVAVMVHALIVNCFLYVG